MNKKQLMKIDWKNPLMAEKEFMLLVPTGEKLHLDKSLFADPKQPFHVLFLTPTQLWTVLEYGLDERVEEELGFRFAFGEKTIMDTSLVEGFGKVVDKEFSSLDRRDRTYTHTLFLIETIIKEAKRLGKPLIFDLRGM